MKKLFIVVLSITLALSLVAGCTKDKIQEENIPQNIEQQQGEQESLYEEKELVLFFPDKGNNFLLHEFRKVTVKKDASKEDLIKIALEELIRGTDNNELKSIIPRETSILTVKAEDSNAIVELTEDFLVDTYTQKEKLLEVFSVVNSITELGIEKITILVKGTPISEYYPFLGQEVSLSRNDDLIPSK